uniref:Uncharacterized protein n=1 Tax=Panagrolaimus sp. ES5 TaxID=591445 RepID=A0AC34GMY2_9BILA
MTKQAKVKSIEPHMIAVKDLNLNELRQLQLGHVQDVIDAKKDQKIIKITGEGDESDELKPFPALADALKHISKYV